MTQDTSNKPNKAPDQRKKSLCQSWRSASALRKVEIVLLAIAATGGLGYLVAYIAVSVSQRSQTRREHAPLVINSHPPELLQPFTCDPKDGLHAGNMQFSVKNVGNARAYDVFPYINLLKIVPEDKVGDALIDALPPIDCDKKVNG